MAGNLSAMTWWEYVTDVAGRTASQTEIAEAAGVSQATVSRWRSGEIRTPEPHSAARFARHYDRNPLEALVVAGVIGEDEVRTQVTLTRHQDPSDEELLDLLRRRLERDRQERDGHEQQPAPMSERDRARLALVEELADDITVGQLREAADGIAGVQVAQEVREAPHARPTGHGVDVPGGGPAPDNTGDFAANRRRALKAEQIAADEVPSAARNDERES